MTLLLSNSNHVDRSSAQLEAQSVSVSLLSLDIDSFSMISTAIFTTIFSGLAADKVAPAIAAAGLSNGLDAANVGRKSSLPLNVPQSDVGP